MEGERSSYIGKLSEHGLLGEGGQASVYLCRDKKDFFAAKVYLPGNSKKEAFKKETDFLSKLNFKNLINMVSFDIETKVKFSNQQEMIRPVIILEYAQGGELFDYIAKAGRFSDEVCRTLTKSILAAIQYLQSVGVAHRDLKPENILFDKDYSIKVSDFGLSTISEGHQGDGFLYTALGTQGYKPPEMQQGKYTGIQADLFAVGVILFVMYSGHPPFLSTKPLDKVYKLFRRKKFEAFWALHEKKKPQGFYPQSFKKLMNSFFSIDINQRPTLESLKQDEWLNGDEALQDDIVKEMRSRLQKILEVDEEKRKIEQQRSEIIQNIMEQEECEKRNQNTSFRSLNKAKEHFAEISLNDLPFSNKPHVTSTTSSASNLVAHLQNFISKAKQEQNIFLKESILTILPKNYHFNFDRQSNVVRIDLMFSVNNEDDNEEEEIKELTITGQLVRLEGGRVGIDWEKNNGNSYWLSCVLTEINSQVQILS